MQIVKLTGLSYPTVRRAIDGDASGGLAEIKPSRRGRAPGQGRWLSPAQEARIKRIICDRRPEQVKMEFALWNRAAVTQLIEQQCGMTLSVRGVGTYLARWGFTPQKPIKKRTSSVLKRYRRGWTRPIRRLRNAPKLRAHRYSGETKRRW
ncbi:hypothetical protein XpopCFBP1817_19240 [Xanthomonas populi]|uniref:Winged helix-turn helix domain-containing protein n=1 Tax=Xanthomonas populi TaxID=53414 RepID=A0A2S7E8E2_9XANT|nr:hypothetical protein XpopCFBP1817_19240 [Xanthomonas populi]